MTAMTAGERREFKSFAKSYVGMIKTRGETHAAQLALAVEEELCRMYEASDERWKEAIESTQETIERAEREVNEHIRKVFAEHGFTNTARMPSFKVGMGWASRGETMSDSRREELRKVAQAQAKLMAKAAVAKATEIVTEFEWKALGEQWPLDHALDELRKLPTAAELMPPLEPQKLHEIAREEHKRTHYRNDWPELMPGENWQTLKDLGAIDPPDDEAPF